MVTPTEDAGPPETPEGPEKSSSPDGTRPRRFALVRRHKALVVMFVLLLVPTLVLGGWVLYLNHQVGEVTRFPADLDREGRPAKVDNGSLNILLVGVDQAQAGKGFSEALTADEWPVGAYRSDAIMVLHLDKGRRRAQLVSIPRDSYVPVEGAGTTKVNAAFSFGGPELLTATVEDLTQLRIDHIAVIDFEGFKGLTEVVDGVDVVVPETVYDSKRDKTWTAGEHHIEGEEALLYVRQRYGLLRGDFDRVQRQQNFLRAVMDKLAETSVLTDPVRVTRLAGQLSELLAVDAGLSNGDLRSLGFSTRGLRADNIRFVTVPNRGSATIDGASVVRLDLPAVRAMFAAIGEDRFARWASNHEVEELPGRDSVS